MFDAMDFYSQKEFYKWQSSFSNFLKKEKSMKVEFIREEPAPPPLKEVKLNFNEDEYIFLQQLLSHGNWDQYGTHFAGAAKRLRGLLNANASKNVSNYEKCFR